MNIGGLLVMDCEQYLNESDSIRVEIEELESLLRQNLRYASRKGGRIFEMFSSKGQSEHLAASRVRWDERQRLMATQEEEARRNVQEVDNEINQNWTAVCQLIAKGMLKYLEDSREMKKQALSPNESSVSMVRTARQARKRRAKSCSSFLAGKDQTRSQPPAWRDGRSNRLERESLALREEVEHQNEKQEVLAFLMEGKMSLQKVALEEFQRQIFWE